MGGRQGERRGHRRERRRRGSLTPSSRRRSCRRDHLVPRPRAAHGFCCEDLRRIHGETSNEETAESVEQDDQAHGGSRMTDQDRPAITPRQRAIEAYESARERTTDSLTESPLIALAGGLAAGALIAALLPRTSAETTALRPTARRVRKSA